MATSTGALGDWERNRQDVLHNIDANARLVQKIIDNDVDAPTAKAGLWADELFREVVIRKLRGMKQLQQDAEHLRIIKSVFSGRS